MSKTIPIVTIAVVVAVGLSAFIQWTAINPAWFSKRRAVDTSMSQSDIMKSMRSMMGVDTAAQLPLKKPADRIERLIAVDMGGVKEFTLNAEPIRWEYETGKYITAWGYNGQVPGPEIRVTEGDRVRVKFTNKLPKATTVHWHGVDVPFDQDGTPASQNAIKPGETYTYEFTATPAGTRFYHAHGSTHGDEAEQLDMGLSGGFIIEPKGYVAPDREYTLVLDEWQVGMDGTKSNSMNMAAMMSGSGMHQMDYNLFTINGRAFPDTAPLKVKKGDRVKIRLINAGTSTTHPMHLHGQNFKITATDGNPVPETARLTKDTVAIAPGERYDIEFTANNEGIWPFHCHELHHADSGMVTTVEYEGFTPTIKPETSTSTPSSGGHNVHGM